MNNFKHPPGHSHHKHVQRKHEAPKKRPDPNEVMPLLLTAWFLLSFAVILVLYLFTRDTTIVVLWTSCIGLIMIVFTYFFQKR